MSLRRTILVATLLAAGICLAQFRPWRDGNGGNPRRDFSGSGNMIRIEGGLVVNEDEIRTARETDSHSSGTPNWTNSAGFEPDVFTFTRVIFHNDPTPRYERGGRFRWLGWRGDDSPAHLDFFSC